jgi:hypothetical protein
MNKNIYKIPVILSLGIILSGCAVDSYSTSAGVYASPGSRASISIQTDPFYDDRFYGGRYGSRYYNHPFYNNRYNDPFLNFHYNGSYNNYDRFYNRPPIIIQRPHHNNRPDRPHSDRPHHKR